MSGRIQIAMIMVTVGTLGTANLLVAQSGTRGSGGQGGSGPTHPSSYGSTTIYPPFVPTDIPFPQPGVSPFQQEGNPLQDEVRPSQEQTRKAPEIPFEVKLWKFLKNAQYRNWAPLPGQSDAEYGGRTPHGEKARLYVNRIAAGQPIDFPSGSILIQEDYDRTGKTLKSINVMYRSKGSVPDAGDWTWTKYEPDGTVSKLKGTRLAGRVKMCIDCHKTAAGDDYVFSNDNESAVIRNAH